MPNKSHYLFLLKTFNLLGRHRPRTLILIQALTLFTAVSSGFSLMLLIPLLQLLNIEGGEATNGIALFFKNLTDNAGITLSIELILAVYVAIITINALLQYWKSILNGSYQKTFIYELRRRLFRKIILADWPQINTKSKTNHLQVLTHEVPNMASYLYYYLHLLVTLIFILSYTAWALAISVPFTLLTITIGGLLFFLLKKYLVRSYQLGKGYVASYNRLLKHIDDFWETVKIAKVHNSEDFYYARFDEASTSLLDIEFRLQKNWALPSLVYRIAGIFILAFIVFTGYKLEMIPLASFFILILLFSRIFPQLQTLNNDVNTIIANIPSVNLVLTLDEEFQVSEFHPDINHSTLPLEKEIRLDNLRFAYPDGEPLFGGFTDTIPARKITGIVGESGRGKTTLIDLIAGLQKPDAGTISVDGQILGDEQLPAWKRSIGYLPQDSFFVDGTLRENLVWDSREEISDERIGEVLEQVNAGHLITRHPKGLDEFIVNYPFCFSGGERQRLALARVLLRNPRLLLLDEATSSLDPENEHQVMEVIARLKEKVTVVFVTHRVSLHPWFDKLIRI